MASSRKLEVVIAGDASSLNRAFGQANRSASGFGATLTKVTGFAALAVGAAGLGGIALTLRAGYKEWISSTQAASQTGAVLKSTGHAAHVTAKQVDDLAKSILAKTGIDDEMVKSGENMLLTFHEIQNRVGANNDIFTQATHVVADLSVAMGMDMKTAALQVGKALNDPERGMARLQRIGVSFTQGQKDAVAAMVKLGDTAGAQKVILKELNTEFGGSAEAFGKTLPGQIGILREQFNNMAGDIVAKLMPSFESLVAWTTANLPRIEEVATKVFDDIGKAIDIFVGVGRQVLDFYERHKTLVLATAAAVGAAVVTIEAITIATKLWVAAQLAINVMLSANPIGIVIIALAGLAAAVVVLYQRSETAHRIIDSAFEAIRSTVVTVVTTLQGLWERFGGTITSVAATSFNAALSIIRNVVDAIVGILELFGDLLHGRWGEIWDDMKKIVSNALAAVGTMLLNAVKVLLTIGEALGSAIVDGMEAGLAGLGALLVRMVKAPINAIVDAWNAMGVPGFDIGGFDPPGPGPKIPGVHVPGVSFPNIPHLDTGGYVSQTGLAVVHRGETFSGVGGAAGGVVVNVTVNGWVGDDQQLAVKIRDSLTSLKRVNGNLGLA